MWYFLLNLFRDSQIGENVNLTKKNLEVYIYMIRVMPKSTWDHYFKKKKKQFQ